MARDPKYDVLFEPVRIGPKTMKNRFYQTPHCCGLGSDFPGAQAYFRGMKAEGGWAVVNTEYCSIHPEADDAPFIPAKLWDDTDVRNLAVMVDKVHEHGALAGVELHYGGSHATGYETRLVGRGPSQIISDSWLTHSCIAMDKTEIRELEEFYVAAALRARSAGFDLIDVHGREVASVLVHFLMRGFNKRTDEYGGSLVNRARLWLETIERVKEAVGEDCGIVVGFTADSWHEDGTGISVDEEGAGFVELADHLVDLWNVQVGGKTLAQWTDDAGPSRFFAQNSQREWLQRLRPYTKKPVVGVGRFTDADVMVRVIRDGQLDIIGAARPSIADPFLPKKIEEGRLDDVRECIGCNICVSRFEQGGARIVCTQNATSGEEYRRRWHPERFDRARNSDNDVVIVGGGPAGMECAVVLGKRGMRRVHLVDAGAELGGSMRWIPQLHGLAEWNRVVDYRRVQLAKLRNVEVIPNTTLSAEEVREYGGDLVVIATGSNWATDGLNGTTHMPIPGADAKSPNCLTPEQIMVEGKEIGGDHVVVYDCEGYFMGASLAEKLARDGKQVTVVTPLEKVAPYMTYTGEGLRMHRLLYDLGVRLLPSHVVTRISAGHVQVVFEHRPYDELSFPADAVVLVTQRVSNERLYRELRASDDALRDSGIAGIYRIGDCIAPRLVAECIFDGHRLAREIDSADPAKHLPYIRENRVLGARDEDYESVLAREANSVIAGSSG